MNTGSATKTKSEKQSTLKTTPVKVEMYSTALCPYCVRAKMLLEHKGIEIVELRVDQDRALREEMVRRSNRRSVPQIFIDDRHIGGFDELSGLERSDTLDPLLGRVHT